MRINKFVAGATGMSRRGADRAIEDGRLSVNGQPAATGMDVSLEDSVALDGEIIITTDVTRTIMLNKPIGYVCSRNGQGSRTIYDLLPVEYHTLKPVGRLDKDSSGLLLLTNDGDVANQLTHPRYAKTKIYEIKLGHALAPLHQQIITDRGIQLEDGSSQLSLQKTDNSGQNWQVTMKEGRNRQIRRTFAALGYTVTGLHRTHFGSYQLTDLSISHFKLTD